MFRNCLTQDFIRYAIVLFFLISEYGAAWAQTVATSPDTVRISLLTCDAGEDIYTHFGHTAIRYEHPSQGIDVVFNYGVFNFNAPNFIYRFVKGETDYMLAAVEYKHFEADYAFANRAVWQQTLNLTPEEKEKLFQLLRNNSLPQNRVYRYNFFFDNCSTRARDKIEESIDGEIVYQTTGNRKTFREMIYQHTKGYEWDRFGMDFCLGVETDRLVDYREEMFMPFYLMDAFSDAVIVDGRGNKRALVSDTATLVSKQPAVKEKALFELTPLRSALLLFIVIASATIYGIRKKKSLWGIDLLLFASAGLAGCIIAFLSCFSEHPAVNPNYLIFVFHPLHLIMLPFFLYREAKGRKSYYHLINTIVLTLFILIWPINPQHFNLAVLPLALCLLIRSVSNLIVSYRHAPEKKKGRAGRWRDKINK